MHQVFLLKELLSIFLLLGKASILENNYIDGFDSTVIHYWIEEPCRRLQFSFQDQGNSALSESE